MFAEIHLGCLCVQNKTNQEESTSYRYANNPQQTKCLTSDSLTNVIKVLTVVMVSVFISTGLDYKGEEEGVPSRVNKTL